MTSNHHTYQVGAHSAPVFAQQGQVDWIAFGNTIWNITSAVLQRFASADIQPVTYGAAIALGCQFSLGEHGRAKVNKALQTLSGTSSAFQKLLRFGFGQNSFVNLISANEPGLQCVALCACLTNIHSLNAAAYILSDLWQSCNCPTEYQPSHEQFINLLKNCEGVLGHTTFGETAERLLGKMRLSIDGEAPDTAEKLEWTRCAESSATARVLSALFDISVGKTQQIIVQGRAEGAFVGAVASWLLDLNVQIPGIFNNTPEGQSPHVIIEYIPANVVQSSLPSGQLSSTASRIESQTFLLEYSGDFWSQLGAGAADDSSSLLLYRVPWRSCFYRTFGSRFLKLCELSLMLSDFIGSAA